MSKILVDSVSKTLSETEANGDQGTAFPYGNSVKYECDAHRCDYSYVDALTVAEFVNQSSWITRNR